MLEPDYPPHASFDDPELALTHARAIYDAGVAHLRQHLAAFVAGQVPGERVRACYPMVRVQVDRAIADGTAHGFVKVLTVPGKDRILGVTIVGEHAGDLLAEYVLAMKHGLGLNKILGTIHTYPTLSEANKYAAGEWKRAHQPERLLRWVRRYHDWRRG